MRIAISAESTIDLPKELLEKYEIYIIPFTIILGEETALDGEVDSKVLFDYTDKTGKLPKTSAINEFQYQEYFESLKAKGYDAIIHYSLSSAISSACSNAKSAASKMENVFVIDTRSLSTGIALQAIAGRKLVEKGLSPKEIFEISEKRVSACQASFSLESVNHLYKGGRCSLLSMLGANLLHIKPAIYVNAETGKMAPGKKKFRGSMMKAVMDYVEECLSLFPTPDKSLVFITYSSAPDDVVEAVRARLKEVGFETIYNTKAGATISCHCGPHCLGILYFNDGK